MIKRKIHWVDFSEPLGLYPWRIFNQRGVLMVEVPNPVTGWWNVESYSDHVNDITIWLNEL